VTSWRDILGAPMPPVFRILGPLEVELGDRPVVALGRRERALLGVLLLNAGEVVSVERLIDGVWGEVPPNSAKHMVHEYVSRLRVALGDASRIQTRVPGYLVVCGDEELDARLFSRLVAEARAAASSGDHTQALRSYDQALGLWRGDALTGVELEGSAHIDVARLDQERRLLAEERVESALALGRHRELLPELEHRVEEEPMRERARAQLMLALYRAGRQTDALERYREGRALLVERAGVEPGRELRELERAILQQDPALDPPAPTRRDRRSPEVVPAAAARRRWIPVAAAAVLVAALGALAVFLLSRPDSASALTHIDANSAGAIDPGTDRLVEQVRVGAGPGRLAAGFGSLWVANDFAGTVSRVDPASGTVQQTIRVDGDPTGIAVGAGYVWVACAATRSVDKIDPQVERVVLRVPVGNGPSGVAISPGAVWVTNRLDDNVSEFDSKTGRFRGTFAVGDGPSDIAYGLGALWIANETSSTVTRLDPGTGRVQDVRVGNGPEAVAVGDGSVWVANGLDGTLSRVDPARMLVTHTISVGSSPSSVMAGAGAVWVADGYGGRVARVDPARNVLVTAISTGSGPQSLASFGGKVWMSARETSHVHRGGTLRVSDFIAQGALDSAVGSGEVDWSALSSVGDGLVGFKRVGGLDGGTLVPDLATSLPTATGGGLVYTFQLHRGVRYSNGELVRASDFRRAIERSLHFAPESGYAAGDFVARELVGGGGCSKLRCDLSRGVVTDDRAGTVTLRLAHPDAELFYKLALPMSDPVPPGTPMRKLVPLGVPGTGPYKVQSYRHARLVLVRNPWFKEWSAAAQPYGYPDRIVLTFSAKDPHARSEQLTAVERGRSDLMESPPASRLGEVASRYAAQLHVFRSPTTFGFFLNTRVPPFNSLKARQAFNFAVDRAKALPPFGGAAGAAVTCQILPVGTPGYRPYCPSTRHPGSVWSGPDLALARKLVKASGTYGQKVVFWTGAHPFERAVPPLAIATLEKLGYRASLKVIPDESYFPKVDDPRTRAQAGFVAWQADYPSASNFLEPFTCGALRSATAPGVDPAQICDPKLDHAVERALAQQVTDPPAANDAWTAIDRRVTDMAAWVPLVNGKSDVVVSRRVGNVQSNPQWGILLDQLWVK
jgi:ABC-type transport system substrate-binding protein/DNA-binding SARP family transcriptional activator